MIPHIIHQFWDRPTPPDDVAACIASWRELHPNWTHILWNDESAQTFIHSQFGLRAARCFAAAAISSTRSDLLRVAALNVIGGVYADADTRCLRPVGRLLKGGTECLFETKNTERVFLRMALIISEPRHPLMQRFWEAILDGIENRSSDPVDEISGPAELNRVWSAAPRSERQRVTILDPRVAKRYFMNERQLAYRAGSHWMQEQHRVAIIDFDRAGRVDKLERIAKTRRAEAARESPSERR